MIDIKGLRCMHYWSILKTLTRLTRLTLYMTPMKIDTESFREFLFLHTRDDNAREAVVKYMTIMNSNIFCDYKYLYFFHMKFVFVDQSYTAQFFVLTFAKYIVLIVFFILCPCASAMSPSTW